MGWVESLNLSIHLSLSSKIYEKVGPLYIFHLEVSDQWIEGSFLALILPVSA